MTDTGFTKRCYVYKVIMSCKTIDQITYALNWSYKVCPEIWLSRLSTSIDAHIDKIYNKSIDKEP